MKSMSVLLKTKQYLTIWADTSDECYSRKAKALKRKREKNNGKGKGKKKKKNEQMNVGEEDDDEEEEYVTCFLQSCSDIPLDESEIGQSFNLDKRDVLTNKYNQSSFDLL